MRNVRNLVFCLFASMMFSGCGGGAIGELLDGDISGAWKEFNQPCDWGVCSDDVVTITVDQTSPDINTSVGDDRAPVIYAGDTKLLVKGVEDSIVAVILDENNDPIDITIAVGDNSVLSAQIDPDTEFDSAYPLNVQFDLMGLKEGSTTFTIIAEDSTGRETHKTFDITVVNATDGTDDDDDNTTDNGSGDDDDDDDDSGNGTDPDAIPYDPNACLDGWDIIADDYNQPEGTTKDGITFTSYVSPTSTAIKLYYLKQPISDANNANYLGSFKDSDQEVTASLSINEVYYAKGFFYIKHPTSGKCFRGSFPSSELTPPDTTLIEVTSD